MSRLNSSLVDLGASERAFLCSETRPFKKTDLHELSEKAKSLSPEAIREKLSRINRKVQFASQGHEIEVVSSKTAMTWASAKTTKLELLHDGTVQATGRYHYVVIVPFDHLAIDDEELLAGEIHHELGHIRYTDWKSMKDLCEWAKSQGYAEELMSSLINCLEDPRQEHASTLPLHLEGHVKKWFWKKNRDLILPNIAECLEKAHPVTQFDFLIKLYCLWRIHQKEAEAEGLHPWDDLSTLHSKVQEAWKQVQEAVEQVVGIGRPPRPEMIWENVKRQIQTVLWPEKKKLIDEFGVPPEPFPSLEPGHGGEGSAGTCGSHFEGEPEEQEGKEGSVLSQLIEQYKKRKAEEGEERKEELERIAKANAAIKKEQHERQKRLDGIDSQDIRKKYLQFQREAKVVMGRMARLFDKYFPKIAYPRDIFKTRGKRYNIREHLKRFGTGMEKPMGTPNIPEKSGFVLQLIIDVSGSMYHGRIDEVIKTVIGILEASQEFPIYIEVLASDNKHGGIDERYILKAFDEEFSGASAGRIKTRLIQALSVFGGGNEDAKSLEWAIPRIEAKKRSLQPEYDHLAALTIFFSDAEVEGQQDPAVVNRLRGKVPILGGCIEPDPKIIHTVQQAYGPIGEGSFCPSSLAGFPSALEGILRKRIRLMFRK